MREPMIQGWCPGALRPMLSGDGLVVRVRPRAGRLAAAQAQGLAALAARHGNAVIELSARANIQLRGISTASVAAVVEGLAALGLVDETPDAEARRNVVVTPFWTAGDGVQPLAAALEAALTAADAPALPAKFGFAVDCSDAPVLQQVSADIRLERDHGGRLICRADGAQRGALVTAQTAVATMLDLMRWFIASGGASGGRGRMAAHLARGAQLPPGFVAVAAPAASGFTPGPGAVGPGVLVAFAFGQLSAATLARLADLGALRVTPWRMLLVEGADAVPACAEIITRRDDPLLRVVACIGAPGCRQALQPTRPLARALAPHVPEHALLHVSGCAKGCAQPGPAHTTLTASATGFDLIRNGRADAAPALRALSVEALPVCPDLLTGSF